MPDFPNELVEAAAKACKMPGATECMKPHTTHTNEKAKRGQRRAMSGRTCPSCKRGNALRRTDSPGWVGKACRYCDYGTGRWV